MARHFRFRPRLERLEDRCTPAHLIRLDGGGNLTILFDPPAGNVDLSFTAPNTVNVVENAVDQGTYVVNGNLSLTLGNSITPPAVTVDLNGFTFTGNLSVRTGNAAPPLGYTVLLESTGGTGQIQGNVTVTTGNGNDQVMIGGNSDLVIAGSVSANLGGGGGGNSDVLDIGLNGGSSIEGSLTVTNATLLELNMGLVVGGYLSVNSSTKTQDVKVELDTTSVVGANATITTGLGHDEVTLNGTIHGLASVSLGNSPASGNDFFFGGQVLGSLTVTGGTGVDTFFLAGAVLGNLSVNGGGGNNTLQFGVGATVGGSQIVYTGGNGVDTLIVFDLTAPAARLTAIMGAGNDVIDWSPALPLLASASLDLGTGANVFVPPPAPIFFPFTLRSA